MNYEHRNWKKQPRLSMDKESFNLGFRLGIGVGMIAMTAIGYVSGVIQL